ncbi:hypothetical protein [Microvirga sp. VF16]|uniref:hypothetical protein n=1 Tax=Microvirga sp. VF16 TaxID=2807101 RepID=UPI00193CBF99|nr:hypothetical protein [Microvirga sp. VF16]QRM35538.1 hypothetical protein JO965_45225 [Microvirga sp. VF16]
MSIEVNNAAPGGAAKGVDPAVGILAEIEMLRGKSKAKTATPAEKLRLRRLSLDLAELRLAQKTAALAEKRRKIETQQKVILGGWVLHAKGDPRLAALLRESLFDYLNDRDRAVMADLLAEIGG